MKRVQLNKSVETLIQNTKVIPNHQHKNEGKKKLFEFVVFKQERNTNNKIFWYSSELGIVTIDDLSFNHNF